MEKYRVVFAKYVQLLVLFLFLVSSISKPGDYFLKWSRKSSFSTIIYVQLGSEFKTPLSGKVDPFLIPCLLILFGFIRIMNAIGLSPYTFTPTSRISITVSIVITVWLFIEVSYFLKAFSSFLIHLVPTGTPGALIPLIVIIELVRNFIRPITLSVRLAANIVAGHLLIRLINRGSPLSPARGLILIGGLILFFLEVGVAFIQGYVFSTLRVIYLSELNHSITL